MLQSEQKSVWTKLVLASLVRGIKEGTEKLCATQLESFEVVFKFKDDKSEVVILLYVGGLVILNAEIRGMKYAKDLLNSFQS